MEAVIVDTNCFYKGFSSSYSSINSDRQWSLHKSCLNGDSLTWPSTCSPWTQLNNYDTPLDGNWGATGILKGFQSTHSAAFQDRVFMSYICPWATQFGQQESSCIESGFVNSLQTSFDYKSPSNAAASQFGYISGMYSYHDNSSEDRRWIFRSCNLIPKRCMPALLPSLTNGAWSCSSFDDVGYISGATCNHTCNVGYLSTNTSGTISCNEKTWSAPTFSCIGRDCGALTNPANGSYICPLGTTYPNSCYLACNSGFFISGSPANVGCSSTGEWINSSAICLPRNCSSPKTTQNGAYNCPSGTTFPNNCTLTCNSGYYPSGVSNLTCTGSGTWSGYEACVIINCGIPPAVANGYYFCPTGTSYLTNCSMACNTGYQLTGGTTATSNITCLGTRVWSNSSDTNVTCSLKDCGTPLHPANGTYNCSSGTTYSNTCTMSCNPGFNTNGLTTLTCQHTGSWSSYGTCVAKNCGTPLNPTKGTYTCLSGTKFPNTCLMSCGSGYSINGSKTLSCTTSGSWSGYGTCVTSSASTISTSVAPSATLSPTSNSNNRNSTSNSEGATSNIGFIAGAVGGVSLLCLLVAVLVVLRKRRNQQQKLQEIMIKESQTELFECTVQLNDVTNMSSSVLLSSKENLSSDDQTRPSSGSSSGGGGSLEPTYDITPYSKLVLAHPTIKKELIIDGVLGNGSFGIVKLGRIPTTCVPSYCKDLISKHSKEKYLLCAVKTLKERSSEKSKRDFIEEGKMMSNFNHPNVIRVIAVLLDTIPPMLVTEFMKYGDLKGVLNKSERYSLFWKEREFMYVLLQIAQGMEYLESIKFIHRDLAARNCLVSEGLVVKISDFGLSKELAGEKDYYLLQTKGKLPVKWMAPEAIGYRRFTHATDVWSYGVVMWEVFSYAQTPYTQLHAAQVPSYIDRGERLECPTSCFTLPIVYEWMLRCWEYDPVKRPSFRESIQFLSDQLNLPMINSQEIRNIGELL